jgi:hypothetical protein
VSVYHEALKSGRITEDDIREAGGIRKALKAVKRREARQRSNNVPYKRTKRYRKEMASRG